MGVVEFLIKAVFDVVTYKRFKIHFLGCPSLIRSDRGKENHLVGQMQIAFHMRKLGNQARLRFRMGTSVHNQASF